MNVQYGCDWPVRVRCGRRPHARRWPTMPALPGLSWPVPAVLAWTSPTPTNTLTTVFARHALLRPLPNDAAVATSSMASGRHKLRRTITFFQGTLQAELYPPSSFYARRPSPSTLASRTTQTRAPYGISISLPAQLSTPLGKPRGGVGEAHRCLSTVLW
jgi:hypothetical protein